MREEILKEENSNYYGGAAGRVGVKSHEEHYTFALVMRKDVTKDDVCINGGSVCAIKHKP